MVYNFNTNQCENIETGEVIDDLVFERLTGIATAGNRRPKGRSRTVKRAIITNTLVREESGKGGSEWRRFLEKVSGWLQHGSPELVPSL